MESERGGREGGGEKEWKMVTGMNKREEAAGDKKEGEERGGRSYEA